MDYCEQCTEYEDQIVAQEEEIERLKKQMRIIIAQFAHDDDDDFGTWLANMEWVIRESSEMLSESGSLYQVKVDPTMPKGTVEFRDDSGTVIGTITNFDEQESGEKGE